MKLSPRELVQYLRRDVALRGGLISAAATVLAMLLLSAFIWLFLAERLETRIEDSLTARHGVSLNNATVMTEEERQIVRRFRRGLPVRDEGALSWIDHDGVYFNGNVTDLECREGFFDGWVDITRSAVETPIPVLAEAPSDLSIHDRFRFLAKPRTQGCLIFGRSMYEVDATRQSMSRLLLWLIPLCLLPALLVSLLQSWRMPVDGDDDIDQLANTANHSFDRLQESVSTMQQLSSVMAHDLRAPLNRVAIPLDEAIHASQAGTPAAAALEVVKNSLADVRAIFDTLLRISQIESGRQRSKFVDIDLCLIAESLFEIYQPVVADEGRTLEFEASGNGTTTIYGDKEMIRQAVVNLIENATRYAPKGSVITICVLRDAERPTLIIRDNGPGLPEDEIPRVLRRLYRYRGSTNGKEGLGLSLVKAVVEVHEGSVRLKDADPGLLVRLQFQAAELS